MKTFFLALILGIFLGSIATHYFSDPDAYAKLKESKAELFARGQVEAEPPAKTTSESPPPAMFEVAGGEFQTDRTPIPSEEDSPSPEPETSPESTPEPEEEPELTETPEASAPATKPDEVETETEEEETTENYADELIEKGIEKSKEVAELAEPHIDKGIDITIAAAIRAQFKLERRIESDALEIAVKDRAVTLSGSVPSAAIKQLAIEIAVFTKGVTGVEESITVEP